MRVLIAVPLLIILVAFALSNQQPVNVGLWPTDIRIETPLSIAILVAAFIFFVVGAFIAWGGTVSARSRARRAERQARQLEAQLKELRSRPPEVVRSPRSDVALLPPG